MENCITIGHLIDELSKYPNDFTVDFSGLDFDRVKQRGDTHVQIEFIQAVFRTAQGTVVVHNLEQPTRQK